MYKKYYLNLFINGVHSLKTYIAVANKEYIVSTTERAVDYFAKSKKGKAAEVGGAEHTSGARQSTKGKHQKGQTRKQQKNRDKKRNKSGWKQH